jgi:hypothetical protein
MTDSAEKLKYFEAVSHKLSDLTYSITESVEDKLSQLDC